MPYPSPADEPRGGCAAALLLLLALAAAVAGVGGCASQALAGDGATASPARSDGPIYDLPADVRQSIVCDSRNREYLLLTTDGGGVAIIPYMGDGGEQVVMPQE